jgi:hypothetical protein
MNKTLGLIFTMVLVACPQPTSNTVASVTISPPQAVLLVGGTRQFTSQALNANGAVVAGAMLVFSSSNPAVATVDANGLATGIALGQSTITATLQNSNISASSVVAVQSNTATVATWSTMVTEYRGQNGLRLAFSCPANSEMTFNTVWGTDTYTDDSSVCSAAVHAGKITTAGGEILLEIRPGENSYTGTRRNGVTSLNYGNWGGSYVFVNP